jgi:hypothetical protein
MDDWEEEETVEIRPRIELPNDQAVYECFFGRPDWLFAKIPLMPAPMRPPKHTVILHPFANMGSLESSVNAMRAWIFARRFDG